MKDNYTYPAIFDYSEEGYINISFPDLPEAYSYAEDENKAIEYAQDVLALTIRDYEEIGRDIPRASVDVHAKKQQKIVYINIWMPYHRSKIKEEYVKKTLTIPTWLNLLALQNNINFSAVLVNGLKKDLHLEE